MSLVNNSANNFKDFLDAIKPYLNYQFYDMSGQGVEAMNLSTDEKVIGTWIDGKPLYQKSITLSNIETGSHAFDHNISNLDIITYATGNLKRSDNKQVIIPFAYYGGLGSQLSVGDITSQKFTIFVGSDFGNLFNYTNCGSVTFRYTKTTDTAVASGEKIVGQWIDGKPLYEKTIVVENPTSTGTSIQYAHNISNFGELIDIKGITQLSTSAISANVYIGADYHSMISADNTYLYYNIKWGQTSITKLSATLRYTKTT